MHSKGTSIIVTFVTVVILLVDPLVTLEIDQGASTPDKIISDLSEDGESNIPDGVVDPQDPVTEHIQPTADKTPDLENTTASPDDDSEPGSCTTHKSGLLECAGGSEEAARAAARRHLSASPPADTCPADEGECPAPASPAAGAPADEEVCPEGWSAAAGDACHDAGHQMRATQPDARRYCRAQGGALAHPVTARDVAEFVTLGRDVWVGAEYSAAAARWQWLDGAPLPGNVSLLGGRHPEPGRRCVRLTARRPDGSGGGSFVKTACDALHALVCRAPLRQPRRLRAAESSASEEEKKAPAPAAAAAGTAEEEEVTDPCPVPWSNIGGWCHVNPRLVGDWSSGELWCNARHGSKLVSLRSREHELAVDALVAGEDSYHIGMRYRRAPASWGWVDGEKSNYRNWKYGRNPVWVDDDLKDVSCAYRSVRKDHWAPVECRAERMFVCAFKLPDMPLKPGAG